MLDLPIDPHVSSIVAAVRDRGGAVVVAPPGSGKTTRVPPALPGRVLVTQPRRVAARLAATRIAAERGTTPGGEIGWSTRFQRRAGPKTRVELLTEGLLLRRLQADPFLEGVDCVVLDEFHERTVQVDLVLALLMECRAAGRADLGVVVMSATMDPEPVAAFLGCPVITAPGRTFPVEVEHARPSDARVEQRCAAAVRAVLRDEPEGHVLVFLPGVAEIERTGRLLGDVPADVLPLHGSLSLERQAAALAPAARRKVVLATNIAETSVTLEGARVVVDSGLVRRAAYDPAIGLTRLRTAVVSRASADQRAGRAGRTGPGRCVRLWTEAEHRGRPPAETPELGRADLAPSVLQILDAGGDPEELPWFEPPPPAGLAAARAVLRSLGATDDRGRISATGRALASLPVHPRLGAVLLAGKGLDLEATTTTAVALISEPDPFREVPQAGDGDLEPRLAAVAEAEWTGRAPAGASARRLKELQRVRTQLSRRLTTVAGVAPDDGLEGLVPDLVRALLAGFPGRLARRRGDSDRYLLGSGRGAVLDRRSRARGELLFALELRSARRGERAEHRILSAHPVDVDVSALPARDEVRFDPSTESVVLRRVTRLGDLVLRDVQTDRRPSADRAAACLLDAARAAPERALSPSPAARGVLARLRFASTRSDRFGGAPESFVDLLPALCVGRRSFTELRKADLGAALLTALDWNQRAALDRVAPERLRVPSGSALPVDYTVDPPVLAARIQQLFGAVETPRVGGVPVMLHLLAPNGRPAQITQDLGGFWRTSYAAVRKDLRGRYPKHPWPEDPASAEPTNRAKRRR